jgi:transcriptional regulator with XRE-family HTH domain
MMLGWTQGDLAAKSGVSARSLTRFENGLDEPSPKVRDKLYRAFVNADIQFIAANTETVELDGVGLRWKPKLPHSGIKIV